jgi:hypothetical protein
MEAIDTVSWEAHHSGMTEPKRYRWVFVSKHTSGMCGAGKFRSDGNSDKAAHALGVGNMRMHLMYGSVKG